MNMNERIPLEEWKAKKQAEREALGQKQLAAMESFCGSGKALSVYLYGRGRLGSRLSSGNAALVLQQIPLADRSVDVILCNHLLEHVADDRLAMREFHRILRPGGWGVLLSPVDRSRAVTFEDDSITDPAERTRIFGQYDHRRIYGQDYGQRLREAGFDVEEIDYAARFSERERRLYALPEDWIYIVRKRSDR